MTFRATVSIELDEAKSLTELLGQIAQIGGGAAIRVVTSGEPAQVQAETVAPKSTGRRASTKGEANTPATSIEQSKPQGESSQASNPQAGTSPAAGGEASSPAQTATQAPAPAPASAKTKSKDELVSELRAILTPHAQKGDAQRAEVNNFVKAAGFTMITTIPEDKLPGLIEAAREKF